MTTPPKAPTKRLDALSALVEKPTAFRWNIYVTPAARRRSWDGVCQPSPRQCGFHERRD